jgi:hypothetical protein
MPSRSIRRRRSGAILGSSDGGRNQQFPLASRPVVRNTLRLESNRATGYERGAKCQTSSPPARRLTRPRRSTAIVATGDRLNAASVAYVRNQT